MTCSVHMSASSPQGLAGADPWHRSRCVPEQASLLLPKEDITEGGETLT